jgi:hypothetical protein
MPRTGGRRRETGQAIGEFEPRDLLGHVYVGGRRQLVGFVEGADHEVDLVAITIGFVGQWTAAGAAERPPDGG